LYSYKIDRVFRKFGKMETAENLDCDNFYLESGDRCLINTGIAATVGKGYEIQIRPRSGNALKRGITVLNTPGTIDESYRGMIGVILFNASNVRCLIERGQRIAQMIVSPVVLPNISVVDDLDITKRNDGGFGHTGTKELLNETE
ncbi:MAG: dUTP diphosphatase, partial [bacterium]